MRTIVIGAGFTGVQLARKLLANHHRVVLIDSDAERVRDVGSQLDCAVVHSQGNSLEVLEKAGIASADAIVAVAQSDEVNMIACSLADAVYPKVLKIARVRNHVYCNDVDHAARNYAEAFSGTRRPPFGIDRLINPDFEVAAAISRAIVHGAVGGVVELGQGYGIVTVTLGAKSPLNGTPLWRLSSVPGWHFLVAHVETAAGAVLPGGETVLSPGDRLGVLAKEDELSAVAALCDAGPFSTGNGRMAIVGAGSVGSVLVAQHLAGAWADERIPKAARRFEVAVVDASVSRCRAMVERFREVRVFCGDATDETLVREEGLDHFDVVVAASENYERNLVTAAYLKSAGVKKAIALTATSSVARMAMRLGVDVAVPLRGTVVDSIMSHLRGHNVKSVHTVCNGAFEIVECQVAKGSKSVGKALRDVGLPAGAGLVLLLHGADGVSCVPRGDTVMAEGSTVVLIVAAGNNDAVRMVAG